MTRFGGADLKSHADARGGLDARLGASLVLRTGLTFRPTVRSGTGGRAPLHSARQPEGVHSRAPAQAVALLIEFG
jgi:hypothetical protein